MNNSKTRLYFIDNLRWLMIILVVLMHINVTYSTFGGWYYIEKSKLDIFETLYFGIYGSFVQAFFMGFLFFIAGYFVPASYDRKGFGTFIRERSFRLGIPTLIFALLLHPLTIIIMNYYLNRQMNIPKDYIQYIISFKFVGSTGPLWFALALLIFSIIYAITRKIHFIKLNPGKSVVIGSKQIIAAGFIITVFTFLTRIVFPIGTNILNMQLCFFPQYIVLFIFGIYFSRKNLLLKIDHRLGMKWFKYTLIFGSLFWLVIVVVANGSGNKKGLDAFAGYFSWGNAAYSFWESFFCVGVCAGLIVWFREKFNRQGQLAKFLSDNAFGVYVFHTPILVFISMLMKNIAMYPFFKYLVVAIITVPVSFIATYLLRKVPGVSRVIK